MDFSSSFLIIEFWLKFLKINGMYHKLQKNQKTRVVTEI